MADARILGLSDDTELLLADAVGQGYTPVLEVHGGQLSGESVDPGNCGCDESIMVETLTAFIRDPEGKVVDRQVRIRAQCGQCGSKLAIDLEGQRPRAGGAGVVHSMTPVNG